MAAAARTQAHPGAAERIAERIVALAGNSKSAGQRVSESASWRG
jgi:hypothetical protein